MEHTNVWDVIAYTDDMNNDVDFMSFIESCSMRVEYLEI